LAQLAPRAMPQAHTCTMNSWSMGYTAIHVLWLYPKPSLFLHLRRRYFSVALISF